MRLRPSVEHDDSEVDDLDLSGIDDDPLTYFLTPAPLLDGDDLVMMDFDAGIEDAKRPPLTVRSVSPSNLGGLGLPLPRPPTPPRAPPSPDLDVDMPATPEGESYMDFVRAHSLPLSLKDFAAWTGRGKTKAGEYEHGDDFLSPTPYVSTNPGRGRGLAQPGYSMSYRRDNEPSLRKPSRLSPHSWREPSPDVWSIEEEEVDEVDDRGRKSGGDTKASRPISIVVSHSTDAPAAKLKKKVRFVLPVEQY
jgi:hypothetical protein